jgi:hypothetical protein
MQDREGIDRECAIDAVHLAGFYEFTGRCERQVVGVDCTHGFVLKNKGVLFQFCVDVGFAVVVEVSVGRLID